MMNGKKTKTNKQKCDMKNVCKEFYSKEARRPANKYWLDLSTLVTQEGP